MVRRSKLAMRLATLPLASIRRPLQRSLDEAKVDTLMASIAREGQKEPIDVLEVDGQLWGFNGCHRVAAHERLGLPTIRARVRRADAETLRLHLR
jgi:sulfiredoxin